MAPSPGGPPAVAPVRLASIDLGTNTIRLLVVEVGPRQRLEFLHQAQVIVRLGERLSATGRLGGEAIGRSRDAVLHYYERARALGAQQVSVVATSAVRDAPNRGELLDPLREAGVAVRLVSGEEEGRLALLGTRWGLGLGAERFGLLDIGGGSTELIVAAEGEVERIVSLPLGVVHLTERYLRADPVDEVEYRALAAHVRDVLTAERGLRSGSLPTLVGTAGTITTLAALDLGLPAYDPERVNRHRLTADAIEALRARLGPLPVAERAQLPCLEPGRADLIIAGIAIALETLRAAGLDALTVSEYGLREGILLEAIGWAPAP